MNSENAIVVRDLSKVYRIYSHAGDRLKEALSFTKKRYSSDFTALKNINFEIKKGEFFGIVGRNGAGKSTLLKLLSKELTPTTGNIDLYGKVSLLQIGVGFDPELSGRENATFAARIMGFSDKDLPQILDKIEEFAEIGEFFNHPVKTYSSGMHSRLSFSTAINVDPEILIVDEVLAVGDIRFSQKCLRKMHEFKENGKTVVLVTHDTGSVSVFCDRAMWIKDGTIYEIGNAKQVSEDYRNFMLLNKLPVHIENKEHSKKNETGTQQETADGIQWEDLRHHPQVNDGNCAITHFAVYEKGSFEKKIIFNGDENIVIMMKVKTFKNLTDAHFGWALYDKNGLIALHSNNQTCGNDIEILKENSDYVVKFEICLPGLNNGEFVFTITMGEMLDTSCRIHDIFPIKVERYSPNDRKRQYGYINITKQNFFIEKIDD